VSGNFLAEPGAGGIGESAKKTCTPREYQGKTIHNPNVHIA
jgi:hypothetical protein